MKYIVGLLGFILAMSNAFPLNSAREADWKKVNDAVQKGRPRSAIAALEPIIQGALADRAYPEAAKAVARKIALEGTIEGNKPEEKIVRLQTEIAKLPKELHPILETILANWYWHYFQNNQWRFMQRTATAEAPGKDFTTWDLPRLFAEIDKHFQSALSSPDLLRKTPIAAYDDLLPKGTMSDAARPTLYDFIVHEALGFYTSGEQAAAKPQDAFEISAADPIFGTPEQFLAWKPSTPDTDSPALKAIRLFQDLLRFHQWDADPTAFIDAELARLAYGHDFAFGEDRHTLYKGALKRVVDQWADHELSALALYSWARVLQEEEDLVQARQLAQKGLKNFPESLGGKSCQNLIAEIEAKSIALTIEHVWNQPWPKVHLHYRNVPQVHFRAVHADWESFLEDGRRRPDQLNEEQRKQFCRKPPALEWSAQLPATADFKERQQTVPAPEQLKPGYYFILASPDPEFGGQDNQVSFTDVWVSDLALVIRPRDGNIEGFVLEANSGEPVPGAVVAAWYLDQRGRWVPTPEKNTDEQGLFSFPALQDRRYVLRARHQGRELASEHDCAAPRAARPRSSEQILFFTDRSIYRPGQIIQYKGIALRVDADRDDYQLLAGRQLTVVFSDHNGKEIARQRQRCNPYGSFSGSFNAPRDRLTGRMSIRTQEIPAGVAAINVEEYKRPKFQVTLDPPKTAARLNENAALQGHAIAYTGAPVDGAQVKYRVVRQVRMPYWWGWCWWRRPTPETTAEIAHGIARTEADGSFQIEFPAKPDPAVSEKDEPVFIFTIYADVTDTAGETRSAQRGINLGYTALQATLRADEWQTESQPVLLKLSTQTLDAQPQAAEGSLKVYRLKAPAQVRRSPLPPSRGWDRDLDEPESEPEDPSDPNRWTLGEIVLEKGFTTDAAGEAEFSVKLGVGQYRAVLQTQDRFGKPVTALLPIRVLDPNANKLAIKIPHLLAAPRWSLEPGAEFLAVWGTGYAAGRAFVEIEHRHKMVQRFWTTPGRTQQQIKLAVTEAMRGGFSLHVTQVRENRAYLVSRHIDVPWSNKNLALSWEHFTSKLQPGQKETWTLVVKPTARGPEAAPLQENALAEMVAGLYDESLDAFLPHHWPQDFLFFRQDYSTAHAVFQNMPHPFYWLQGQWDSHQVSIQITYRMFPPDLTENLWGHARRLMRSDLASDQAEGYVLSAAPPAKAPAPAASGRTLREEDSPSAAPAEKPPPKGLDLAQVSARKNLNETAFFFPQLISDTNGVVKLQFTIPEALTQWKFMGFAHDQAIRSGYLEGRVVTAKDLMVQPNPPRFLREGDTLEFTVKISNQTAARQTGKVRLTFNEVLSEKSADPTLGNLNPEQPFDIPAKQSRTYTWKITVPDGLGFLSYKAVAGTGRVSDGEEGYLPVLSRRVLVTESLPLPIRGPATKKFEFPALLQSGQSRSLRHQSLTVQMVSNPAWYAVLALPYLMEYPHECAEQVFNRLYANALARTLANGDPNIRRIFDLWKNTPALDSPLEKNEDLKSVSVQETPWLRQAQSESQARRNIGILFDENRLNYELDHALRKLADLQLPDGAWPWFPGGPANDYITLYITTGFGRLRHFGVDLNLQPAIRSLDRLDHWIDERYRSIVKHADKTDPHLTEQIALYLYGRSFYLKDKAIAAPYKPALDFFLEQARTHWLKLPHRQSQAHLALALHRFGDPAGAKAIMRSIYERSVTDDELGRFWRDTERSWWWYRAPIETQALMIEAFDEVMNDAKVVEECKVWLLKQKQTQDWKTTKATADAVYALLLRGRDVLASDALVQIELGGRNLTPPADATPAREPGTGFYETRLQASEIQPRLGKISVTKTDEGVAWGSVHWQYLQDISQVAPHQGTPLKLTKSLFKKVASKKGPLLQPVKTGLSVGDELVVRIELRTDRDMEYVHLKDQRGSGTEPVNVLSGYRFQDGLAYYQSTQDTASHFFIDYLPKGVYVFEYSTRVQHRGRYQTGLAEIQCMYAPEFNSHSESFPLVVK